MDGGEEMITHIQRGMVAKKKDDPLVDIAVIIGDLTRIFKKHNLKPPAEFLFASKDDYFKFLTISRESKRWLEVFDKTDVTTSPSSSSIMGVRITYKRPQP
jgi:hypothetical protein